MKKINQSLYDSNQAVIEAIEQFNLDCDVEDYDDGYLTPLDIQRRHNQTNDTSHYEITLMLWWPTQRVLIDTRWMTWQVEIYRWWDSEITQLSNDEVAKVINIYWLE